MTAITWNQIDKNHDGHLDKNEVTKANKNGVKNIWVNMTKKDYNARGLATVNGNFHVGMTADEAKEKNLFKTKLGRDFTDIDKNGDGILSADEIIKEREKECKSYKNNSAYGFGSAITLAGTGVTSAITGLGAVATIGFLGTAAVTSLFAYYDLYKAGKEEKITKQYK